MLDMIAVSPHPDDVELCCGGLIAKMTEKGYKVGIVDLTRGEMGTEGTAGIRLQEAKKAAQILGADVRENMDFGDCKLGYGFKEGRKLADVIRKHKPLILIAPYGDDDHPDHAAAKELAKKAAFFSRLRRIETQHEPHRLRSIIYYMLHKPFEPTFIVDVTDSYEKKKKSIRAYQSQIELISSYGGLLRTIRIRDQLYGSRIGAEYGEPFLSDAPLKIEDPVAFLR
jgi:bacillithiol biosynthesis deacetylase BshB1